MPMGWMGVVPIVILGALVLWNVWRYVTTSREFAGGEVVAYRFLFNAFTFAVFSGGYALGLLLGLYLGR